MGDIFEFINESLKSFQMMESTLSFSLFMRLGFNYYMSHIHWTVGTGVCTILRLWQEVPPHDSKIGAWCVNASLFFKTILKGIWNRYSAYFSSSQQMNAGVHPSMKTLLMLYCIYTNNLQVPGDRLCGEQIPPTAPCRNFICGDEPKTNVYRPNPTTTEKPKKVSNRKISLVPRTTMQECKPLTKLSRMQVQQQGVFQHLLQFEHISIVGLLFQLVVLICMDPMWMEKQPFLTHERVKQFDAILTRISPSTKCAYLHYWISKELMMWWTNKESPLYKPLENWMNRA